MTEQLPKKSIPYDLQQFFLDAGATVEDLEKALQELLSLFSHSADQQAEYNAL